MKPATNPGRTTIRSVVIGLLPTAAPFAAVATAQGAQTPAGTASRTRVQQSLTVNEVPSLRGYLGERWEANRKGSLHGFDIERYVRLVEERNHRDWWWAGEQDGKWLESAVLSSVHSDPALRRKAESVLVRVIASQEPSGYLGVTARDIRTPEKPLRGMDPYEDYFRLHALITAFEQWGDEDALDAARGFGDYLLDTIGPGKAEFWPSDLRPPENRGKTLQGGSEIAGHAVHYSWEGTLLIDPMLRLADATGDAQYTEWCEWVVGNIDRWSGWDSFSKLDKVAAGEMGIHEVQPYVHSHTFHMNFLGFLRLYEITGDASLLRKVAGAWRDIADRQMYITGGVSVGEHYEARRIRPLSGHAVETCATMSWLQVTQYLLELTGDPKYADAMERLLWNHVFASQAVDGDTYRYHTPPNGIKPAGYFHGPDCCTSSGHRMVSLLPTFLYGKDGRGVYVNQYGATTVDADLGERGTFRLRQETDYPEGEAITLIVEAAPEEATSLRLRIPGWCASPRVTSRGVPVPDVRPGRYLELVEAWQPGDEIDLVLPMQPKWVQSNADWSTAIHRLPGGEIMHNTEDGAPQPWALTRGPVVYAADTTWWDGSGAPAPKLVGEDLAVIPDIARVREAPAPQGVVGPAFEIPCVTLEGEEVEMTMLPFTNIGQWYRPGEARPDRHAGTYSYAIWLQSADSPVFAERARLVQERERRLADAVDYIEIGNPDSERAHVVQGGSTGEFNGRTYRHGHDFSYQMRVPPERDASLVVMYWGSDVRRVFDVIADDRVLATQELMNNRPGEFYEETYAIPADLISGKTDGFGRKVETVSIRFRSRNNDVAGGVFGIRVE